MLLLFAAVLSTSCRGPGTTGTGSLQGSGGHGETAVGADARSGEMGPGMAMHGGGGYSDERFVDAMVPHHQGAIDMAKVALDHAEHPQLRRLAETIISSQQAEIDELRSIKKAEYGTSNVPSRVSPQEMKGMGMMGDPTALADRRPFDEAFMDAMVPHHEAAVKMAREALKKSSYPGIQDAAEGIVEAQEREIHDMELWRREWYPNGYSGSQGS